MLPCLRCSPPRTTPAAPQPAHDLCLHLRLHPLSRLHRAPPEGPAARPEALSPGFRNPRPPLHHFQIPATRDFLTSLAPSSTQPPHAMAARVPGIPNPVAAMAAQPGAPPHRQRPPSQPPLRRSAPAMPELGVALLSSYGGPATWEPLPLGAAVLPSRVAIDRLLQLLSFLPFSLTKIKREICEGYIGFNI